MHVACFLHYLKCTNTAAAAAAAFNHLNESKSKTWSRYWVKLKERKWDRGAERGREDMRARGPRGGPEGDSSHQMSNKSKVME